MRYILWGTWGVAIFILASAIIKSMLVSAAIIAKAGLQ